MDEIKSLGWRDDYNPKYVEVSFSNAVILNVLIVDQHFQQNGWKNLKNLEHIQQQMVLMI